MKPTLIATLLLTSIPAVAQRPDLHAGGAKPSTIPNHETTLVTLPGFHLAGPPSPSPVSAPSSPTRVVSDTQLTMMIEGHRPSPKGRWLLPHRPSRSLTPAPTLSSTSPKPSGTRSTPKSVAHDQAQGEAYVAHLGKQWTLHYANGTSETFNAQPVEDGSSGPRIQKHLRHLRKNPDLERRHGYDDGRFSACAPALSPTVKSKTASPGASANPTEPGLPSKNRHPPAKISPVLTIVTTPAPLSLRSHISTPNRRMLKK